MNIKQYFNDLKYVQNAINNLSGLDTWKDASTNQFFDSSLLDKYVTSISGLNKEQALLALSTKELSDEQKAQILTTAELVGQETKLTASQVSERVAKKLNSEEDAKQLLISSGLVTQKELESNATIKITAEKLNEAIANKTLSASNAEVIAGAVGITGVNVGASVSFSTLTAAIWTNIKALGTWLVTNPVGWAILAGGAIWGLVKAYNALTPSVEDAKEALSQTESDLDSLQQQIDDTTSKIKELESMDTLSITDKEDLEQLKQQNEELRIRQQYLE